MRSKGAFGASAINTLRIAERRYVQDISADDTLRFNGSASFSMKYSFTPQAVLAFSGQTQASSRKPLMALSTLTFGQNVPVVGRRRLYVRSTVKFESLVSFAMTSLSASAYTLHVRYEPRELQVQPERFEQ